MNKFVFVAEIPWKVFQDEIDSKINMLSYNLILRNIRKIKYNVNDLIFMRILLMSRIASCCELFDVEFVRNVIWLLRMNYENWTLSRSIVQSFVCTNVVSYSHIFNWDYFSACWNSVFSVFLTIKYF